MLIGTVEEPSDALRHVDTLKRPAAWLRQAGVTDDRRDLKTGVEGSIGLRIPTIARHARAVRRGRSSMILATANRLIREIRQPAKIRVQNSPHRDHRVIVSIAKAAGREVKTVRDLVALAVPVRSSPKQG